MFYSLYSVIFADFFPFQMIEAVKHRIAVLYLLKCSLLLISESFFIIFNSSQNNQQKLKIQDIFLKKSTKVKNMSISDRLQKLRGRKTLVEFARENQTSPQNIHNYEKGRNPSADFLTSLASKDVNINWVLTGEGPIYIKKTVKGIAPLTSALEKLPEEFKEALQIAVRQAGHRPPTNRKLRLALWYQKLLRKIHDEIDRLHDI